MKFPKFRRHAPLAVVLLLAGCPASSSNAPSAVCTKLSATCKLDQGLLGVCTESATSTCDGAPCLVCMSQH